MRIALISLATTLASLAACGPQATYKDSRGDDLVVSLDQPNIQDFNLAADKMVQSMMVSGVLNNAPAHSPRLAGITKLLFPPGTGMPASARSCRAWYSWIFMGVRGPWGRAV